MYEPVLPSRRIIVWRAALFPNGSQQHIPVRTREVGLSAISVLSDHPLPEKTPCKLLLEVPATDRSRCEYIEVNASVVYASLIGGSHAYRINLRVQDMPLSTQEQLRRSLR